MKETLLHVTARAPEGHRLRFDPCSSMKVLGSWCDDKGGSTGSELVASRQQCLPQTRDSAEGSRTAHCGTDTSFPSSKRGLDVARHREASPGQRRSQEAQQAGRDAASEQWDGRRRRGNWETHHNFMERTEDALDGICTKNEILRVHIKVLLRLYRGGRE